MIGGFREFGRWGKVPGGWKSIRDSSPLIDPPAGLKPCTMVLGGGEMNFCQPWHARVSEKEEPDFVRCFLSTSAAGGNAAATERPFTAAQALVPFAPQGKAPRPLDPRAEQRPAPAPNRFFYRFGAYPAPITSFTAPPFFTPPERKLITKLYWIDTLYRRFLLTRSENESRSYIGLICIMHN